MRRRVLTILTAGLAALGASGCTAYDSGPPEYSY